MTISWLVLQIQKLWKISYLSNILLPRDKSYSTPWVLTLSMTVWHFILEF